jgi:hypothetical protein
MKYINNLIEFVTGCKFLPSQVNQNFKILREGHNDLVDRSVYYNDKIHEHSARIKDLEKRILALEDGLAFWSGFSKSMGWQTDKLEKRTLELEAKLKEHSPKGSLEIHNEIMKIIFYGQQEYTDKRSILNKLKSLSLEINNVKEGKIVEYDADIVPKQPVPLDFKDLPQDVKDQWKELTKEEEKTND